MNALAGLSILMVAALAVCLIPRLRFWFLKRWSAKWPTAEATIERGGVLKEASRAGRFYRSFLGLSFAVGGVNKFSYFALETESEIEAHKLQEKLPGRQVMVRYDAARPELCKLQDEGIEDLPVSYHPDMTGPGLQDHLIDLGIDPNSADKNPHS
jgi:hypothetical protein